MHKLTARGVAAARFDDGKPRKRFDGGGLFQHVTRTGRKWRYAYRLGGAEKTYTIGSADTISLAEVQHADDRVVAVEPGAAGGDDGAEDPVWTPGTFIWMVTAVAALYGLFVVYRLSRRDSAPAEDTEPYRQVNGQAPLGPELAPVVDDAVG